jgi:oligopeptide transport system substrate-binding protein
MSYPKPSTIALQMQMEKQPLDNEKVRLALSRAIDRETLANDILQGAVLPTTSWIPADVADIKPDEFDSKVGFDPEAAKKLLDEAGFPNGQGFPKMTILIRDTPSNTATAQFLQSEFETHLNIDIDIEIVDAPTRSKRFTTEDFELFPGGWNQDYPDPENWIIGLFDKDGTLNHYNCFDPDIDALIEKARYNSNDEERLDQYREVNELISTRACGGAPMYNQAQNILVSTDIGGIEEFRGPQDRVLAADWAPEEWFLDK